MLRFRWNINTPGPLLPIGLQRLKVLNWCAYHIHSLTLTVLRGSRWQTPLGLFSQMEESGDGSRILKSTVLSWLPESFHYHLWNLSFDRGTIINEPTRIWGQNTGVLWPGTPGQLASTFSLPCSLQAPRISFSFPKMTSYFLSLESRLSPNLCPLFRYKSNPDLQFHPFATDSHFILLLKLFLLHVKILPYFFSCSQYKAESQPCPSPPLLMSAMSVEMS